MQISILNKRKDNKYKVSFYYPGGDNGFGGTYAGKQFNKLLTHEQLIKCVKDHPDNHASFPQWLINEASK